MNKTRTLTLVIASLCLSLCMVLPFLFGQIPTIGKMLCPMHIPVFLCGCICGGPFGFLIGLIAPVLRALLFGSPVLYPTSICMALELASYGFVFPLLLKKFKYTTWGIYASLLISMFLGRVVWGIARVIFGEVTNTPFTWKLFIAGGFANALPGILLQMLLIPTILIILKRNHKLFWREEEL